MILPGYSILSFINDPTPEAAQPLPGTPQRAECLCLQAPWGQSSTKAGEGQLQSTPASSSWLQLWAPQLLLLQFHSVVSVPRHATLSSQMFPVPRFRKRKEGKESGIRVQAQRPICAQGLSCGLDDISLTSTQAQGADHLYSAFYPLKKVSSKYFIFNPCMI